MARTIDEKFKDFTNQFSLTKTIRMELVPENENAKNLSKDYKNSKKNISAFIPRIFIREIIGLKFYLTMPPRQRQFMSLKSFLIALRLSALAMAQTILKCLNMPMKPMRFPTPIPS